MPRLRDWPFEKNPRLEWRRIWFNRIATVAILGAATYPAVEAVEGLVDLYHKFDAPHVVDQPKTVPNTDLQETVPVPPPDPDFSTETVPEDPPV